MSEIIDRIEDEAETDKLVAILAERIAPTDLLSLLLEVYRRRARKLQPREVLHAYETDRFLRPAKVSPDRLNRWERIAFDELASNFELVSLSTVCPLGTSSVIAPIDQNWVITTSRNNEVLSDVTNVLALECALRRRALLRSKSKSTNPVHLAANQRVVRAQRYEDASLSSHFSLLGLASAGRDEGKRRFELSAARLHIQSHLRAILAWIGMEADLVVTVTSFDKDAGHDWLEASLLEPLRSEFVGIECQVDPDRTSGRGYYSSLAFHVNATSDSGALIELTDGGDVDWTQKLLSNAKERVVISGLGSERICMMAGGKED